MKYMRHSDGTTEDTTLDGYIRCMQYTEGVVLAITHEHDIDRTKQVLQNRFPGRTIEHAINEYGDSEYRVSAGHPGEFQPV